MAAWSLKALLWNYWGIEKVITSQARWVSTKFHHRYFLLKEEIKVSSVSEKSTWKELTY